MNPNHEGFHGEEILGGATMSSKELLSKLGRERPNIMSYEELLTIILGDEFEEELGILAQVYDYSWRDVMKSVTMNMEPIPGVRSSTLSRLYAIKVVGESLFG